MKEQEREQLTAAVLGMLEYVQRYGNRHGTPAVELDDDGGIELVVNSSSHSLWVIIRADDVSDVLGDDWNAELEEDDEAVEAALRDGAKWWVEAHGQEALAEARARVVTEIDTGGVV